MKTLFLAVALIASVGVHAGPPPPIGHVTAATIDMIRIDKDGFVTIYFSNYVWAEAGSCRSAGLDQALGFDSKTLAGQSLLATMLGSKAKNYTLNGEGTGLCIMPPRASRR